MCGFAGFISIDRLSDPEFVVNAMSKEISHRGPDDHGLWSDNNKKIFLSFRRLSILDLSKHGSQPMLSKTNRYVICFNGEIYNHQSIRNEINQLNIGYQWRGSSDTETILAAIEVYGFNTALEKCTGMFAISLYDKKENILLLARDRFGEKPLYFGGDSKNFIFGSDLSSFKKHPNFNNKISLRALKLYTNYSYVPAPYSIYEDYYKVQPGQIIKVSVDSLDMSKSYYWDLKEEFYNAKNNKFKTYEEGLEVIEDRLLASVKDQMISDVPLGAFLSGGLDSSLIAGMMQSVSSIPIKTFTIGFDDPAYDESVYAEKVANYLETDHTTAFLQPKEAIDVIPELPNIYSEPFADSSQIPTYLVSKIAKQDVTVALSGDGGDEMFAGYNRYFWGENIWKYLSWMPFSGRKFVGSFLNSLPHVVLDAGQSVFNRSMRENSINFFSQKVRRLSSRLENVKDDVDLYSSLCTEWHDNTHLFSNNFINSYESQLKFKFHESLTQVENMMLCDIETYLKEDILAKVDRAAMFNSLETRAPFLNHAVAKEAWRFPANMLYEKNRGKLPLRSILSKFVPSELFERPKSGFGIPVGAWLRSELAEWAEDLLNDQSIKSSEFFDSRQINTIWNNHKANTSDNTVKLWNILMFISWFRNNNS